MRRAKDPRRTKIHCEFDPHQRYLCKSDGMEYASASNTETCGFKSHLLYYARMTELGNEHDSDSCA